MARRVVLYIAMSLDGYIADRWGGVGWLSGHDGAGPVDDGYDDFIETVDTVVMGMRTYEQVTRELSPGLWPYQGMRGYVASGQARQPTEDVAFIGGDIAGFVQEMKREDTGKDIWIVGGAELAGLFMAQDAIDIYEITIAPVILGGGVRLFTGEMDDIPLYLEDQRRVGGMVMLRYTRRKARM